MYNLRYHIASLVSVFLALSLGLVLGGLIVQQGSFSGQPQALVEGLRKEFADLRKENKQLAADNAEYQAFSAAAASDWVAGKLANRTIYVVTNSGRNDGLSAATQAIEAAGGTAVVVTMKAARFGLDDDKLRSAAESLAADAEKPEESVAASLAAEWTNATDARPVTAALVEAGVISVEGLEETKDDTGADVIPVAAGFVNIDAPGSKADTAGLALQSALAGLQVPTVGAQSAGTKWTLASAAADLDLSAIDTLGTDIGKYSLVALLKGAKTGYYGTASRAAALFPAFPAKASVQ